VRLLVSFTRNILYGLLHSLKLYLSWFVDPDNISENKVINTLKQEAQAVNQTKLISNLMLYIFRATILRV
jgi:hypothetical protein